MGSLTTKVYSLNVSIRLVLVSNALMLKSPRIRDPLVESMNSVSLLQKLSFDDVLDLYKFIMSKVESNYWFDEFIKYHFITISQWIY